MHCAVYIHASVHFYYTAEDLQKTPTIEEIDVVSTQYCNQWRQIGNNA